MTTPSPRADRIAWPWLAMGLWLAATIALMYLRPLLPVDETRAIAVAWEMRTGGNWLVPHLNGAIYAEKPPLLAWLINLSWALFGVSEAAVRMVTPAIGLVTLSLTAAVARRLAPRRDPGIQRAAALVLVATPLWTLWASLALYDLPLATAAIGAHAMGLAFAAGGPFAWMVGAGLALGAGVLFKGPVVLAHVLPAWLAWRWWRPQGGPSAGRWAAGVTLAVVIAAAAGLGWALSAAATGGESYGNTLIVDQTVRRLGGEARHGKPWWWYAPVLFGVLLPWTLRPGTWAGVFRRPQGESPPGSPRPWRYLGAWLGGALLIISAAGGKQPHYLIPMLPGIAIAIALALPPVGTQQWRLDGWLPALGLLGLAGVLAAGPALCAGRLEAGVCAAVRPGWALVPAAAGMAVLLAPRRIPHPTRILAAVTVAALLALAAWARPIVALQRTDEMAEAISTLQARGVTVAQLGRYQGQYHFAGRLGHPVPWFEEPAGLAAWAAAHPSDYVIVYSDDDPGAAAAGADLVVPYRGHVAMLWKADRALAMGVIRHPDQPEQWGTESATD